MGIKISWNFVMHIKPFLGPLCVPRTYTFMDTSGCVLRIMDQSTRFGVSAMSD